MDGYILDTHVLVWFLEGSSKLSATCRNILLTADVNLFVPAMAILEAIDLVRKRRTTLDLSSFEAVLAAEKRIQVVPIDQSIEMMTARFPDLADIHDRCIVGVTASLIGCGKSVILLTADKDITLSKLVPTLW